MHYEYQLLFAYSVRELYPYSFLKGSLLLLKGVLGLVPFALEVSLVLVPLLLVVVLTPVLILLEGVLDPVLILKALIH